MHSSDLRPRCVANIYGEQREDNYERASRPSGTVNALSRYRSSILIIALSIFIAASDKLSLSRAPDTPHRVEAGVYNWQRTLCSTYARDPRFRDCACNVREESTDFGARAVYARGSLFFLLIHFSFFLSISLAFSFLV